MKKLILAITFTLIFSSLCLALTFHNGKQPTLTWNAVTTDVDGDPVTGITYKLYLINKSSGSDRSNPTQVAETSDTQTTITLTKGIYYIGVQACLDDLSSDINWGDQLDYQEGVELFGLRFAVPPKAAHNLKKQK